MEDNTPIESQLRDSSKLTRIEDVKRIPKLDEIKGLVLKNAPRTSIYHRQQVVVGVYCFTKDFTPIMLTYLFGPENKKVVFSRKLVNVKYVPIDKIQEYHTLFGCPIMKILKNRHTDVKCVLSIKDVNDIQFEHPKPESLIDKLYRLGFVENCSNDGKGTKMTFIERSYYMYLDKDKKDPVNMYNLLLSKKLDHAKFVKSASSYEMCILEDALHSCFKEVKQRHADLYSLSSYLNDVKESVFGSDETTDAKESYVEIVKSK